MYGPWSKEMAVNAKTEAELMQFVATHSSQDYHSCYYLMNYHGFSCSEARHYWELMRDLIQQNRSP